MAQHHWTARNNGEQAAIFAVAFRSGLANREAGRARFFARPSTLEFDLGRGTDLSIFCDHRPPLRVDVTIFKPPPGMRRGKRVNTKRKKIERTIRKAKEGKGWVYILELLWGDAVFVPADPCWTTAYDQLIRDGQMIALEQACPEHGNECTLARKLWDLSEIINRVMASSKTEARYYVIPVSKPPF